MPIRIPDALPARLTLEHENIFVMTEKRAMYQHIRPLKVLILNLMPTKIVTETQFMRKLSNTPLQVQVELLQTASYTPTHVDSNHLETFYRTFDQVKDYYYDGMIITGAPLELVPFEEVAYWDELCEIMEWSKYHVHSTMHSCWGAFAGLYYHYGINKVILPEKLFGVFPHIITKKNSPLFRGMDDVFLAPHSRNAGIHTDDLFALPQLELMAASKEAGPFMIKSQDNRHFFMFGHPEYDADTLATEYWRDVEKGLNIHVPYNYFPDDDPTKTPIVRWRSTGQLIFSNWLNFYVYQTTPYDLTTLTPKKTDGTEPPLDESAEPGSPEYVI
ncbi:MAG: homoserine O-succinyltransferase [Oscillospiraceae bacterium]|nr:homoserine O-succinyltransferase [Oscillospiraceae bacterium]